MTPSHITPIRKLGQLLACAATHWSQDEGSTAGAALAFFCAFSLAPLLVILLTLSGLIVDAQAAAGQVQTQLEALFGPATAKVLMDATRSAQSAPGALATLISVVTLLIGATTVLSALQAALAKIWGAAGLIGGWKGWIRSRFLSLGFILALGFLLLVSLTITTALTKLQQRFSGPSADSLLGVAAVIDTTASLFIISLLFALIYRYMPVTRTSWRAVLIGGCVTALLFDAGRWGIGLYLSHSTQASAFGAAASFVALLLWLYYTSQIFLFGAEFTACLAGARRANAGNKHPSSRRT